MIDDHCYVCQLLQVGRGKGAAGRFISVSTHARVTIAQERMNAAAGAAETNGRSSSSRSGVLWNLARAQEAGKNYAEALPVYRSYAAARPESMVYDRIGFVEARLGHADKALEALNRALTINSGDATALVYRGLVFMAMGDSNHARADLSRALQIEPGNQIAKNGLAKLMP